VLAFPDHRRGGGVTSSQRTLRSGILRACAVLAILFVPAIASGRGLDVVVQRIGDISGDTAARIAQRVRIVPFSPQLRPRTGPILLGPGRLFLQADGTVGGVDPQQADAIRAAYAAGQPIVVLDANVHDVEALHRLVGSVALHKSSTHPRLLAYALRRENHVPTSTVLTYPQLSPRTAIDPAGDPALDARAATRAVDILVSELTRAPAPGASGSAVGDPIIDWTQSPLMTKSLFIGSWAGYYTTTVQVFALHECSTRNDHYMVTTLADWSADEAKFQSVSTRDGLFVNPAVSINWQDTRGHCDTTQFVSGEEGICRYQWYPLSYELTMKPPQNPDSNNPIIIQKNASPAGTVGIETAYSAGFSFGITGGVNVSAEGPSGGFQAGVTWSNETATTVPPMLIDVTDVSYPGLGWNFRYCTSGDQKGNCVSNVQMQPASANICLDSAIGDPQHGQTKDGKFSNAVQTGDWFALPASRVGRDTFDIEVTFTAHLASTGVRLFSGNLVDNFDPSGPVFADPPFTGDCNIFFCSCSATTSSQGVPASFTFKIPFPSTKCQ
jgi:hypothetical protein